MHLFNGLIIALCLVALLFLSPRFRRAVFRVLVGRPNLGIQELPGIFAGDEGFRIEQDPHKKLPGADESIQAFNSTVSIIYHTTAHAGGVVETVDIASRGKAGMILTLRNGKVTCLQRIGGRTSVNPELTITEKSAIARFMFELQKRLKQA
jgi:hypothetical protein